MSESVKQALEWNTNTGKCLRLKLGESIPIPDAGYDGLKIGLGWNTGDIPTDLDASLILFDKHH